MDRRRAISLLAAAPLMAAWPLGAQTPNVLEEVGKYLNQLTSIRGRFTQINADNSRSAGSYWLRRPGRIRFEYDGGEAMVIADGINIAIFDAKSNAQVQRYPLSQTPLKYLLRERIDLTQRNLVRETGSQGGFTTVVMQDPEAPRDGSMTLVLRNSPPALTEWTVTEASGSRTRVVLDTLEPVTGMNTRIFNIETEALAWERQRR
ncbi:outer membrane lipoprotein carrier protein LolA [Halovulum dunhuangense]|uniref:Outer membrane lipoprotein carrier protein LolA n=1 Tax=Halovulum dunhuangense TaxID=1505036 RepID=A0A849KTN2_9RHOB|nr:outer membrane lipoprotein carrier protein LolA [Halovulum dunhuangense]NNU78871.1 outer membrane lipoprotein carrier protein LolA [Halovulum dunhuangense]